LTTVIILFIPTLWYTLSYKCCGILVDKLNT
jgi:hypothetical protein